MLTPSSWTDYELLDSGDESKLERWGSHILSRPEPTALWPKQKPELWERTDLVFIKGEKNTGRWQRKREVPESWNISYKQLTFKIKPTGFKHTGLFPEQASNWDWIAEHLTNSSTVLNLFGYTGGATLAAALAGAEVTHVDASEGSIEWARENAALSGLAEKPIRWIADDALKFVEREGRRGARYDAIIMDPPSYGRGAHGEVWKLEEKITPLLRACDKILSEQPRFVLINTYTTGFSVATLENLIRTTFTKKIASIESTELGLKGKETLTLPAGTTTRITFA